MRLLLNNELTTAESVTVKSVNPSYPVVNLYDKTLSKLYRSLANNEQYITMINSTAITIDTILLYGHNLTSLATVTLKGTNTLDFVSPDYETTIDVNTVIYKEIPQESFKAWRLEIDDPTNECDCISIQEMFIGCFFQFPSFEIGYSISKNSLSVTATTRGGTKYGNKQGRLESWSLNVSGLTGSEKIELEDIFDNIDIVDSFWFLPFEEDDKYLYVTLPSIPTFQNDKTTYSMNIDLLEQK